MTHALALTPKARAAWRRAADELLIDAIFGHPTDRDIASEDSAGSSERSASAQHEAMAALVSHQAVAL